MSFIELVNVTKVYVLGGAEFFAVNNASFVLEKGEFTVIVGESGAGKTTILNIMGGMDTCDSGSVKMSGVDIAGFTPKQLTAYRRLHVGFVYQHYNLVQNLTALENVELAAEMNKRSFPSLEMLGSVGLTEKADNFPSQLSGGEQQRVAIARALVKNPSLLLCDEPTGALDYRTGKEVLGLLQKLSHSQTMTIALITHNQAITPIANRVIKMKSGSVIEEYVNQSPVPVEEIEW
jgi:putative ABC transport system ATP-binding protein